MKTFTKLICNYFSIILILIAFSFTSNAQCPAGETEITLDFDGGGFFPSEVSFDLSDGTTIYASIDCGLFVGDGTSDDITVCVPDNVALTLTAYDDYGDGWNGELLTVTISEDGSVNGCAGQNSCVVLSEYAPNNGYAGDNVYDCVSDTEGSEMLTFACDATAIDGCTDVAAINYSSCATNDDGSCFLSLPSCALSNPFGVEDNPPITNLGCDGYALNESITTCNFAGEYATINNLAIGETYCFSTSNGVLDYLTLYDDLAGASIGEGLADGTVCVVATTSTIYMQVNLADAACGTETACRESFVNCPNCPLPTDGCTDPCADNYDPNANCDDGSCVGFNAPANDECAAAIDLGAISPIGTCDGYTITSAVDFVCATAGAEALLSSCDTYGTNLDVFFTFTAPPLGGIIYNGITGNSVKLAVYDGGCPGVGTEVECQTFINAGGQAVISNLTPGSVYTMQLWLDDFNADLVEFCLEEIAPPPPEDACAGAIEIPVDNISCGAITIGNNLASTDSGELPEPTCAFYEGGDTWFYLTVPLSGNVTVETSNAGGFTDGGLSLYSGTCGALTEIECNDDGGYGLFSLIELTGQTPGDIIYVRVWEYGNNSFGDFGVCAFDQNPLLACGLGNVSAFSTCTSLDDFAIDITFFSGTATSWEITDGTSTATVTTDGTTGPHTFNTSVLGWPSYPLGTIVTLTVSDGAGTTDCELSTTATIDDCSCFGSSPANDVCADAIPISIGAVCDGTFTNGDNTCAFDEGIIEGSCFAGGANDVWFSFVAPPEGVIDISTDFLGGTNTDTEIAIYSGVCGSLVQVGCDQDGGDVVNFNSIINGIAVVPGDTYLIQVSGWNGAEGSFCLEINIGACFGFLPVNDECAGAINIDAYINSDGFCFTPVDTAVVNTDNTCATSSTALEGPPSATCTDGETDPADIWLSFTAQADTMNFIFDAVPGFSSFAELYEGSCGALTYQDSQNCSNTTFIEYAGLTVGNTYYIRIWDFGSDNFGNHDICLTYGGSTCTQPTGANGIADCTSNSTYDFSFDIDDMGDQAAYDIILNENGVQTDTGLDITGVGTYTITGLTANVVYDIIIQSQSDPSCKVAFLDFSNNCDCFGSEPANDECVDAIALTVGFGAPTPNGPFTNNCATIGSEHPVPAGGCWVGTGGIDNSVWFTFQGTGGDVTIETNNVDPTITDANTDTQIAVYDGCPGSGSIVLDDTGAEVCDDDASANGLMSLVTFPSVAGVTYYLLVDGWNGADGEFTVDVESDVPPCSLNATVSTGDCNPDGTFDVTFNVFGQNLAGDVCITDANGNEFGCFPYMDPFTQISTVLSGDVLVADLFTEYEITITSSDTPSCGITLAPFDVPECAVVECPTLFNASASVNVACDGDEVMFTALLNPSDAENGILSVESGTGLVLIPDFGMPDGNGNYTSSLTLVNNSCEPLTNEYVIRLTCTDDGSTSAIQSEDITIYPTNIEQFISISASSCDATVTVDAGCEAFIDITSASSFTAAEGESGSWDVCYQYFSDSSPGCLDANGCIPVAYDCPSGCTNDAGTMAGNTFLCDGEFVSTSTNGPVVDAGSTLAYVLHDGDDAGIGTVYGTASTGLFMQDGSIPTNVDLCITAVVGDNLDANGIPDGTGCYDASNCYQIVFMDPIVITANPICAADGSTYTVDVSIVGGGPGYLPGVHTFEVTGVGSIQNGQSFQIGPFASGASYTIDITEDGKGCSASYTGSQTCQPTVDCDAGTMPNAVQYACASDFVNSNTAGATVGAGLTLTYVLHDGNDVTLGNVLGSNSAGLFTNDGSVPRNIELCITAVIGNASATGLPDNICDISNCQPIVFLEPVVINDTYVCNEITNEADVSFSITGGGPGYLPSIHTYNVTGDYTNAAAQTGVTYAFNAQSGDTYTINVVDDGKGCGASTTSAQIQCNKLPVELISYTGEVKTDGNLLKWATASEIENDYFTLEVSTNATQFSAIHTEAGNGTVSVPSYYSFLDRDAVAGTSYYRLSQTDYDGTTVVVGIVELTRGESTLSIISIQPNPVVSDFELVFETPTSTNVTISIVDLAGKLMFNEVVQTNAGLNNLEIVSNDYPSGVYFVKIISTDNVITEKFVKE